MMKGAMISVQYAWLVWSVLWVIVWLIVYRSLDTSSEKRKMFVVSLWSSLSGLAQPFFVPEYWAPPSLFDLNTRAGIDIESLIFSFGTAGLAAVLYDRIFHTRSPLICAVPNRRVCSRFVALGWSLSVFALLLFLTELNPIYAAMVAMIVGGSFTWYCHPDLRRKMVMSGLLFSGIYFIYFLTLIMMSPGYVGAVWNMGAISGVLVLGVPLEELLFAFAFGFIWSSIYEHMAKRKEGEG